MSSPGKSEATPESVKKISEAVGRIRKQLGRVIVGQDEVVEELLLAIFSRGHVILEGVPGLAKTLLVSTLARTMNMSFNRIQFTPDLMPSDITGTEVIQEDKASGKRDFKFLPGPVFANIVLADEINRTPPKTQAALLEAMQERQISVGGERHDLPEPFFVLATQNPIEQEGTYPLPEAQQDRFMFKIFVNYPKWDEEFQVVKATTADFDDSVEQVIDAKELLELQKVVRQVPVADHIIHYAMSLVRATRVREEVVPDFVRTSLSWGAGPRASQYLILGGKCLAAFAGRTHVSVDDIQKIARPVLRHRILTTFAAEAEGITTDRVVDQLLEVIPSAEGKILTDGNFARLFSTAEA